MGFFSTNTITLRRSNPSNGQILATGKTVQLDPVNLDWDMKVNGLIPVDIYDCETIGWTTPVPARSDYLIDESDGTVYSMFSTVFKGINSLQFRVTKYGGNTP